MPFAHPLFITLVAVAATVRGCGDTVEALSGRIAEAVRPATAVDHLPSHIAVSVGKLAPAERARYMAYQATYESALAAGDEAAIWLAAERYVAAAAPNFLRDNMILNLGDRAAAAGDRARAAEWYRLAEREGKTESRRFEARLLLIRNLLLDGQEAEARQMIEAIPQYGVGGLDTRLKVTQAGARSRMLLNVGEYDAARLSLLSQNPPPGAGDLRDLYLSEAAGLAYSLGTGDAAAGVAFRSSLLERYPDIAQPPFLEHLADEARRAGRTEVSAAALEMLRSRYPETRAAVKAHGRAAVKALQAGDRAGAEEHLQFLRDSPRPGYWQRWAISESRRYDSLFQSDSDATDPPTGTVEPFAPPQPSEVLQPRPDPAFSPPK